MKRNMAFATMLVMAMAFTTSHVHAVPVATVAATVAKAAVRQLLQAPDYYVCDDSQPFNFYLAPGFGCFLDAPPCTAQWFVSSSSRVTAIQNRRATSQGGNSITHIRYVIVSAALAASG
jgi:hypothetical protein